MKLVMGCCATLLAFALIAPAAHAGWPLKPPKPRDTTPPSVPTGLRVVSVTEDSVTLAWNASTDNSGSIHHYVVSPGSWHPGNSTTKTIGFLVPNWTQTYRVSAADASGNESAPSEPLTVTTAPDLTAPTTPANLRLTAMNSPTSISLAWDRSTDRWAFWYEILMDGQVFATASSTSTRLRKIPFGNHTFTVRARDSGGNRSAESNPLAVSLPDSGDHTPPSPPSNLTAESLEDFCGSVILRWTASTDNVDSQAQIEYEIYKDGAFFGLVTGSDWAGVYADAGTSTWHVVAVDGSANSSAQSNPATVTVVNQDQNLC
jgi:chitodextrinase